MAAGHTKVYPFDFFGNGENSNSTASARLEFLLDCAGTSTLRKKRGAFAGKFLVRFRRYSTPVFLECDDPVNAVRPENAELAFVVTAEVDHAAAAFAGAG
jgi:hypothetical protein